ncbi:MAG: 1-deoxy-D-xylulose-5-phosphate reductoisomerase [Syntrophales bacterium]|jgi:1-deoxy-D-xylulose-5-phosphate reductoisomerase|nr:1-deoxy-D-xylulose-5-phosphate reductoisomerase [Syntrophales bacterium]MCK9390936.1 1-deoxy-D-xylulose-5-phosphate reductoisomerase [Syntrophales bacterium]
MKNIAILGSTGSIGVQALDVIASHGGRFNVTALGAGRNIHLLKEQIEVFRPRVVAVYDDEHAYRLRELSGSRTGTTIVHGPQGYCEVASLQESDMVLSAMVGAAGLIPTLAAIEAGKNIALANKETLVMAGELVMAAADRQGVMILPVDSEHSAIFQCLQGQRREALKRIILTASGGPFHAWSKDALRDVKPAQALKHPNWEMGKKITIDSASMMNKGLEIIEACWLFDMPVDQIEVVVHPQSIIHSFVEYWDGSVMAQLGKPDMRVPIAYALSWPERLPRVGTFMDFRKTSSLEFHPPDEEKFPCLPLACMAVKTGGTMPSVLNGANEIAVQAFLDEEIRFTDIAGVIKNVMNAHQTVFTPALADIINADSEARQRAMKNIKEKRDWLAQA